MQKAVHWFRYSMKSLFVLTTLTASLLTIYFNYFYYYHTTPSEVELGSFKVIAGKPGEMHLCDCRVFMTTNWHDILEQRAREKQKELQQLVVLVIKSTSYEEKCDPSLVVLKNQIKNQVSQEVGSILGYQLVNEVVFSKYAVQQ